MSLTDPPRPVTWQHAGFRIELHPPAPTEPPATCLWIGFHLYDDAWANSTGTDPLIFTGTDLGITGPTFDLNRAVNAVCAYLSLQPDQIDDDYFHTYTPKQRAWRDARAATLAHWAPPAPP